MWIRVELLNGETLDLGVTPETTIRQVKQQMKDMQIWEDDVSRDTTAVELIVGDKKVTNEETVAEVGLSEDSKVSAVFRPNVARSSNQRGLGPDLDPEVLVTVDFPDSETEIAMDAFFCCQRVARVIIPSSVSQIGSYAFSGCSSLVTLIIPDSVAQIGTGAFWSCSSLTSVVIPDSLTHIGVAAFLDCSSLETVTIPDSVTHIGNDAFSGCPRLTLTLPARLLRPEIGVDCTMVAKECGCGQCECSWFAKGWLCPVHHAHQQGNAQFPA